MIKKILPVGIAILIIFNGISTAKTIAIENEGESEFEATGFFRVEEKDDVWWFVTPEGEKFYAAGTDCREPAPFFYGDISEWENMTRQRLKKWGINIGNLDGMPYCFRFKFKNIFGEKGWTHTRTPDVFDPDWQGIVKNVTMECARPLQNDSNLIGYYTDNEMKWGPDATGDGVLGDLYTFLEVYMAAPATTPGKQRLVRYFTERYINISEFNRIWNMNIESFDELFNYSEFGVKEGWRIRSQLRSAKIALLRDYPLFKEEPQLFNKAIKDVEDFSRLVARTYFNVTNTALKTADPNHLNLGVRFHLQGVPEEVLEECGKYVDVISINYYRFNKYVYDPAYRIICKKYNTITLGNWMYSYHNITGKPLVVTEYHFEGNDGSWPNFLEAIVTPTKARTQKRRADLFEWYAMNCLKSPYVIGQMVWFLYSDNLGANWGMVNLWDEPYKPLVNRMAKIFPNAVEIHENACYSKTRTNKILDASFLPEIKPIFREKYSKSDQGITSSDNEHATLDSIIKIQDQQYRPTKYDFSYQDNVIYVDDVPGGGPDDPLEDYTCIQDAIDNASNGDTIFVYNGTYVEKILIDKSISLVGEDRRATAINALYEATIFGSKNNIVVSIEADNVNITEFNITSNGGFMGSSPPFFTCQGVFLNGYNHCNISRNIFTGLNNWGVQALNSNNTKISNNIVYDIDGCGIIVDSSNNAIIENNIFEKNGMYGIWMSSCKNNAISRNMVSNSIFGISIVRANHNTISENTIIENKQKSICLKESNHNIISSNNFINNPKSTLFFYSDDNIWDENYWGRPRVLPKVISGRKGPGGLIPTVNFDWHPAKEPYEI